MNGDDGGDGLRVVRDGALRTITIDRPHRKNAVHEAGWLRLARLLDEIGQDDTTRAVVVTGAGGDFCAGMDLASERLDRHPRTFMRAVSEVVTRLHDLPQPVIAKVEGMAVGAGFNLALACDLVVASTTARFSQAFARRGLSVDFGGSWLLPRAVGMQQAKRLAFLADMIDAHQALRLGAVTWVEEPESVGGFVADLAERLIEAPPVALAETKALMHAASSQTLPESVGDEIRAQLVNLATDAPAAKEAFLRKASPRFTGRWRV